MAETVKARIGFVSGGCCCHATLQQLPAASSERDKVGTRGIGPLSGVALPDCGQEGSYRSPGARVCDEQRLGRLSFLPRRRRKSSIRDCSTI